MYDYSANIFFEHKEGDERIITEVEALIRAKDFDEAMKILMERIKKKEEQKKWVFELDLQCCGDPIRDLDAGPGIIDESIEGEGPVYDGHPLWKKIKQKFGANKTSDQIASSGAAHD